MGKPGKGFLQEFEESNKQHFSMYITKIIEIGKPFFSDHYLGELASYLVCFRERRRVNTEGKSNLQIMFILYVDDSKFTCLIDIFERERER